MSLKTLLAPAITSRLLSRERLLKQRSAAERARVRRGEPHQIHYFHQVDDPYSALAAASLVPLAARYDVDLLVHIVGPPPDAAAPERDKLIAYSRKDAQLLARHYNLDFRDPGRQPSNQALDLAAGKCVAAVEAGRFTEVAEALSACLWTAGADPVEALLSCADLPLASHSAVSSHLAASDALRQRLGHYLGATFFYAGEWYWGIDRLHHLERRLRDLGAHKSDVQGPLFPPARDTREPLGITNPAPIDFFFSLRSPYSAIVAPRIFELGRMAGTVVRLRFVLPMVMRGLPVPRSKRQYIIYDAAREAYEQGIPFGRLNDPVGRPTERGLALIPYAERAGRGQEYVLSIMRGIWAEGIDVGSERGLRKIVERAGLSWDQALSALKDDAWRTTAEINRAELFSMGLWGVPSFRTGTTAVWGQDRLWAVRDALCGTGPDGPAHPARA